MKRKDILIALGASVVSAAAASAITWYVGVRKVEEEYEARLEKEVEETVEFIKKSLMDPNSPVRIDLGEDISVEEEEEQEPLDEVDGERVFPQGNMTLDDLKTKNNLTRYDKILTDEEYKQEEPIEEVEETAPGWDPGEDISVISRDIFLENASEYEQTTLTYFQDEGVIDLDEELVEDHWRLIGHGKPPFGQMSEDENIVYIRNKGIQVEYEVIQDPGNATDFLMHSLIDIYKPSQRL